MKTYTLELTNSQAEDLYFCVSLATSQARFHDCVDLYNSLCYLRQYLLGLGFSYEMK